LARNLSKSEAIEVVESFLVQRLNHEGWYQNISKEIYAILLYGSAAKGLNTEKSDIDVMILLPLEAEKKFTDGEYFYNFRGQTVNVVLRSIEKLREVTSARDEFQKEIFRESEIIWQKDGEVAKLLLELENN